MTSGPKVHPGIVEAIKCEQVYLEPLLVFSSWTSLPGGDSRLADPSTVATSLCPKVMNAGFRVIVDTEGGTPCPTLPSLQEVEGGFEPSLIPKPHL